MLFLHHKPTNGFFKQGLIAFRTRSYDTAVYYFKLAEFANHPLAGRYIELAGNKLKAKRK
jgi:hypothetical protein